MRDSQHEVSNDDEQGNEKERDGRARGKVTSLNAHGEGERGERLRGVEWPAGGENVNDSHVSESEDKAK